ncbi:amino acid ABC transporter ATP-binding protein [Microbacterium sp.]|uniref:amino acid ABC transporter ATP-binding protein n=1 Tax=Microbacterium sp. TaxID=51671 RepID=UPI0039E683E0
MTRDEPIVTMRHVYKHYGANTVLKDVSIDVHPAEVLCIIGPSGSGKSTLLRCVNHLTKVDAGEVRFEGELVGYREKRGKLYELPEREIGLMRARIGMVFQQFNLYPQMTALENVMYGPVKVLKQKPAVVRPRAAALLERVGLGDKQKSYPHQLSGGQQQRVAIARALAGEPALVLFDEPTSALDPEVVGEVIEVMEDLAKAGTTMLVVTHEMGFARHAAHTLLFMDAGMVVEKGTPIQVLDHPTQERTKRFLSQVR